MEGALQRACCRKGGGFAGRIRTDSKLRRITCTTRRPQIATCGSCGLRPACKQKRGYGAFTALGRRGAYLLQARTEGLRQWRQLILFFLQLTCGAGRLESEIFRAAPAGRAPWQEIWVGDQLCTARNARFQPEVPAHGRGILTRQSASRQRHVKLWPSSWRCRTSHPSASKKLQT